MLNLGIIRVVYKGKICLSIKNSKPSTRLFSISQMLLEGITVILQELTGQQVAPSNGTATGHLMGLQLNPMRLLLDVKMGLRLPEGNSRDLLGRYHWSPNPSFCSLFSPALRSPQFLTLPFHVLLFLPSP